MVNRRRENRLQERNRAVVDSLQDAYHRPGFNAATHDLSVGGARILTKEFFDVGSDIRVQIVLARSKQSVILEGRVKWLKVRPDGDLFELGVEFRHEIPATLVALISHLSSREAGIPSSVA